MNRGSRSGSRSPHHSAKVPDAEWAKVESALAAGSGMVSFNAEDTDHHVDISKICYVRREAHVSRVG